jgi:PAS domain S-box-containing protein
LKQEWLIRWLIRYIKRPSFWIILVLLVILTIFHYSSQIEQPGFLADLTARLGLDRHAFERMAFMVPIIYAGFLFGRRDSFLVSLVALACMLPRAIILSPHPADALLETGAVFILANTVALSFDSLRKERQQRTELEWTGKALQFQLRVVKENEKRLAALNQASDILYQSLEIEQILDKATEIATNMMQVEAALIYLVDEEAGELSVAARRGMSTWLTQDMDRVKIGEDICGRVAQTGEPLYIENASQDPMLNGSVFNKKGFQSLMIVPLKSKGKVTGTLCVLTRSYRFFNEYEVELLTAIGSQVGVAIENADLYEHQLEVAEQLRVSEERYRELFENAHDAIWLHDLQENIVAANEALVRLSGYSLRELRDKKSSDLIAEGCLDSVKETEDLLQRGEAIGHLSEVTLIKKDKSEAAVQLSTNPILRDGQLVAFQHIARDMTEEKRMRENLSYYLGELTKAQEEERNRIARELHDDTIQALVVLSRQLDNLVSSGKGFSKDRRAVLENLWQQTTSVLQDLRRLSQDLRPPMLDRLGLLPSLEWLASDVSQYSGIAIKPQVLGTERRMPPEAELMLFRIAQEALRNMWRHSQATEAELIVEFEVGRIRITVKDNGKGFDLPSSVGDLTRSGKLGLAGMRERARLLGGDIKIESEPGKGTSITVEAPI